MPFPQVVKLNVTGARGVQGAKGDPGGGGNSVASKAALAAIDASNGDSWTMGAAGAEGTFTWRTGDFTARVASDPMQGIYIASTVSGKGAGVGCFVRNWDGVHGRPEWFGAVTGGADCLAAIHACYAICPVTVFGSDDYWISDTLILNRSYRKIMGPFNPDGYGTGHGTRILSTDGTADVCHLRPDSTPTTTDGYLRNITIENINFQHGVTRTLPEVGSEKTAIACLRAQYMIDGRITNVYANEPVVGFSFYALIGTHVERCRSFRSASFGSGADIFIGCITTGVVAPGGLIGNNASLYTYEMNATCAGDAVSALTADRRVGFWHDGAISDQFHKGQETLGCNIRVSGLGETDTTAGSADFFIADAVVDQFTGASYDIQGIGKRGCLRLINAYAGLPAEANSGASPHYAVRMQNIGGNVTIEGGDFYVTPNNNSIGISYESSTGVLKLKDPKLHEFARPIGIDTSKNFDIEASISCHSNTPLSAVQGAVALSNAQIGTVEVSVVGKTDAYPQGVICFNALNNKIKIDPTMIDPACIQGGATNKVVINSVAITAPGNYNSDGTAGTTGDDIFVHGITA